MAKRFFFVRAGLLCMAIAFELGARSAGAQSGTAIEGPALAQHGGAIDATGCVNRVLYRSGAPVAPPVPGSSAIIATAVLANSSAPYGVVLANGDIYLFLSTGGWTLSGNMLGAAPTIIEGSTMSQLKVRYR